MEGYNLSIPHPDHKYQTQPQKSHLNDDQKIWRIVFQRMTFLLVSIYTIDLK